MIRACNLLLLAIFSLTSVCCADTVVDIAVATPATGTLVSILLDSRFEDIKNFLVDTSRDDVTVFAPTNDAFAAIGINSADDVTDVDAVKDILLYHVAPGRKTISALVHEQFAVTLQNSDVSVTKTGWWFWSKYFVNEASVALRDVQADDGIIHVIDSVLIPPKNIADLLAETHILSTLLAVVGNEAYSDILTALVTPSDTGLTIFAPTDDAFTALGIDPFAPENIQAVTKILTYHVLGAQNYAADLLDDRIKTTLAGLDVKVSTTNHGRQVLVNDAKVTLANVVAANQVVVHVIDKVLSLPPSIVDLAVATPTLSTLVSILVDERFKAILDVLSTPGPFTVFAPTNDAFAEIGIASAADVTDVDAVANILTYHVLPDSKNLKQLLKDKRSVTVQGDKVKVVKRGRWWWFGGIRYFVNDSKIILNNIDGSNGVVHVIDKVLLP